MSYHRVRKQLFDAPRALDPGNAGTIRARYSPYNVMLVSTTTETRTLARPDKVGQVCRVGAKTAGGAITLTVTGGYDEDGATTFVLDNAGEFACFEAVDVGGTLQWRKTSDHATQVLTQTEIGWLQDITAGTGAVSKAAVLDSSGNFTFPAGTSGEVAFNGNKLSTEAGAGITSGTGTVYQSSVMKVGGIIYTRIMIDLTGLGSSTTDADIIGVGASASHLGRITAARNGTILCGMMTCHEVPATGCDDIDLWSATEATGKFDDAGGATLTETVLVARAAAWAAGDIKPFTGWPAADEYLYLINGEAGTAGTYTAGKFLIEMWGYDA